MEMGSETSYEIQNGRRTGNGERARKERNGNERDGERTGFAPLAVGGLRGWRFARLAVGAVGGLRGCQFARLAVGVLRLAFCGERFVVSVLWWVFSSLSFGD